jgi:hypothetical protein
MSNGNEPAFPHIDSRDGSLPDGDCLCSGLTKRELAAIEIMARIVGSDWTNETYYQDLARRSVLAADALLVALAK